MTYINLLLIFILIIFIHEFGHYFFARIFKLHVTDFSIGFGKSIIKFKDKNNTNWRISLIPLGGYVKIKGLESIFQNNKINFQENNSFQSINLFKKIIILIAGSFFNILSAWLCLFLILIFYGITIFTSEVGDVLNNSPASLNDIRKGDIILSINDNPIDDFREIEKYIYDNEIIKVDLLRNNKILSKKIELVYNKNLQKNIIGISSISTPVIEKFKFYESFKQSVLFIPNYYYETFKYLIKSFKNQTITKELAGPVGIVKMADQLMLDKLNGVLFLFIIISLFVGIFNLLPVPLLDGGHILYFSIQSYFSHSLPAFITRIYLTIGFAIISFLFIFVTFNDIFYK